MFRFVVIISFFLSLAIVSFAQELNCRRSLYSYDLKFYQLRINKKGTAAPTQNINLENIASIMASQTLKDRNGHSFELVNLELSSSRLVVPFHIIHSTLGDIINLGHDDAFPGMIFYRKAYIDATPAYIEFPADFQNLGLLSSVLAGIAHEIPEGTKFDILDASETYEDFEKLKDMPSISIRNFIEKTDEGVKLYKLYLDLTQTEYLQQDPESSIDPSKDPSYLGFRLYLRDILSIHGRFSRRGHLRTQFLNGNHMLMAPNHTTRTKIHFPPDLLQQEESLVGRYQQINQIKVLLGLGTLRSVP